MEVPKKEFKYLMNALDSIKLQVMFQNFVNTRIIKEVDESYEYAQKWEDTDSTIIALTHMLGEHKVHMSELIKKAAETVYRVENEAPEELPEGEEGKKIDYHIRLQQVRNRINRLVNLGFINKLDVEGNKKNKRLEVNTTWFQLETPSKSLISFKIFTP